MASGPPSQGCPTRSRKSPLRGGGAPRQKWGACEEGVWGFFGHGVPATAGRWGAPGVGDNAASGVVEAEDEELVARRGDEEAVQRGSGGAEVLHRHHRAKYLSGGRAPGRGTGVGRRGTGEGRAGRRARDRRGSGRRAPAMRRQLRSTLGLLTGTSTRRARPCSVTRWISRRVPLATTKLSGGAPTAGPPKANLRQAV